MAVGSRRCSVGGGLRRRSRLRWQLGGLVALSVGVGSRAWRAYSGPLVAPAQACDPSASSTSGDRRRAVLVAAAAAATTGGAGGGAAGAAAAASGGPPTQISVPIALDRGAFYLNFTVEGQPFRSVVDTGSPYALVSACTGERRALGRCAEYCDRYGCASPEAGRPSGLPDNDIVFTGARTRAVWRQGRFEIGGVRVGEVAFGVLSEVRSFGGNAGGTNFGLIRAAIADPDIRPTFLSQTAFRAFSVDLRRPDGGRLELWPAAPPQEAGRAEEASIVRLPLVDLRPFGASVVYYAVRVKQLWFDGVDAAGGRDIVAILDTGTTGIALPEALFYEYQTARRKAATAATAQMQAGVDLVSGKKHGNIEVVVRGTGESDMRLPFRRGRVAEYDGTRFDQVSLIDGDAGSIFYRSEQSHPETKRPFVIFVGLAFMLGRRLSVDTDACVATLT